MASASPRLAMTTRSRSTWRNRWGMTSRCQSASTVCLSSWKSSDGSRSGALLAEPVAPAARHLPGTRPHGNASTSARLSQWGPCAGLPGALLRHSDAPRPAWSRPALKLRRRVGLDLLIQPCDQLPIHLGAEVTPAGELGELGRLF